MQHHDRHYRGLFGHPAVMRSLIEAFLPAHWRKLIDLDTLEPLPPDHLDDKQNARPSDIIWRARRTDGSDIFLLILLEHQASGDRFMAVRILGYTALTYQTLRRRGLVQRGKPLPAVLPIVLHTGLRPWRYADNMTDLLDPVPAALQPFQPSMRYLLLDIGVLLRQAPQGDTRLVSLIFQLEHNQGLDHAAQLVQTLTERVARSPDHQELFRLIGAWLRHIILPRAWPRHVPLPDTEDLTELNMAIPHPSRDWTLLPRMEAKQEGQATLLKRLLMKKFGILPHSVVQRLEQASSEQLEAWSLNFVDAQRLDDVFAQNT